MVETLLSALLESESELDLFEILESKFDNSESEAKFLARNALLVATSIINSCACSSPWSSTSSSIFSDIKKTLEKLSRRANDKLGQIRHLFAAIARGLKVLKDDGYFYEIIKEMGID